MERIYADVTKRLPDHRNTRLRDKSAADFRVVRVVPVPRLPLSSNLSTEIIPFTPITQANTRATLPRVMTLCVQIVCGVRSPSAAASPAMPEGYGPQNQAIPRQTKAMQSKPNSKATPRLGRRLQDQGTKGPRDQKTTRPQDYETTDHRATPPSGGSSRTKPD